MARREARFKPSLILKKEKNTYVIIEKKTNYRLSKYRLEIL